jgi:hypothetical protein
MQRPEEIYKYLAEAVDGLTNAENALLKIDVLNHDELHIRRLQQIKKDCMALMDYYIKEVEKALPFYE